MEKGRCGEAEPADNDPSPGRTTALTLLNHYGLFALGLLSVLEGAGVKSMPCSNA